jgi:hypothetical protein
LILNYSVDCPNPFPKRQLKLLCVNNSKNSPKGIVRWNPIRQLQEGLEPDHLTVPKNLHISPAFRSAYDGADRYCNDIDQIVIFRPILPWVADFDKMFFYSF